MPTILGHDTNMLLRKYSRKIQGRKPGRRFRCRQDYVFKVPSGLVSLIRVCRRKQSTVAARKSQVYGMIRWSMRRLQIRFRGTCDDIDRNTQSTIYRSPWQRRAAACARLSRWPFFYSRTQLLYFCLRFWKAWWRLSLQTHFLIPESARDGSTYKSTRGDP